MVVYPYNGILRSNEKEWTVMCNTQINLTYTIINKRSQALTYIFHLYDSIYFSKGQNFRNRNPIIAAKN